MKKIVLLFMCLFVLVSSGCYGILVIVDNNGTDIIKVPHTEGVCIEKAVDLKRSMEKQGYTARVVAWRLKGNPIAHAFVEYEKDGRTRIVDPNDIWELY